MLYIHALSMYVSIYVLHILATLAHIGSSQGVSKKNGKIVELLACWLVLPNNAMMPIFMRKVANAKVVACP